MVPAETLAALEAPADADAPGSDFGSDFGSDTPGREGDPGGGGGGPSDGGVSSDWEVGSGVHVAALEAEIEQLRVDREQLRDDLDEQARP